jgi:two-component system, chemotaxis family, chemotaxis protein CheY
LPRFQGVPVSGAPSVCRTKNMKTCLVVDDSKVVRMVARKILEELGFEVTEAEDGQVALDKSMESMPDVVLLDWNMPVMSGIEYLRALRVTEEGKQPIVVFCTTENDISHIQEGIAAGANEYIMKPFDSDIIQSKFVQTGVL